MKRPWRIVLMVGLLALLVAPGAMTIKGCRAPTTPAHEDGAVKLLAAGDANNLYVIVTEGGGKDARFTYWQRDAAGVWHEPSAGVGAVAAAAAWREHLVVFFPGGRYGLFGLDIPQIQAPPTPVWKPLAVAEDGLALDAIGQVGDELVHGRSEGGPWTVAKIDIPIKVDAVRDPCAARFKGRLFVAWREEVPAIAAQGSSWRLGFAYLDEKGWKGPYPAPGAPGLAMDSAPQIAAAQDTLLCLFKAPPADGKPAAWALAAYTVGDENWHEIVRVAPLDLKESPVLARWRDQFAVAVAPDGRPRVAPLEGQPLGLGPLEGIWPAEETRTPPGMGWTGLALLAAMVATLFLVSRWRGRLARPAPGGHAPPTLAEPHALGRRIAAAAIDHFLAAVGVVAAIMVLSPAAMERWQRDLLVGKETLVLQLVYVGVVLVYYTVAEALTGRTLGKALLGLEVRHVGGGRISIAQSILRNLLRLLDGVPWLLYFVGLVAILMGPLPQRLGDRLAGTIVVRRKSPEPPVS